MKKTLLLGSFIILSGFSNIALACGTCKSCLAKKAAKAEANFSPIALFDQNGDGKFTKAETDAAANLQHHLIKEHDANKDGKLTGAELEKATAEFSSIVKKYDKNGDNKLSKMESAKAHDALEAEHSH